MANASILSVLLPPYKPSFVIVNRLSGAGIRYTVTAIIVMVYVISRDESSELKV